MSWEKQRKVQNIFCSNKIETYIIKFTDSARFMKTSLSSPVHNLAQRIHKTKCKDSDSFLEYKRT